MVLDFNFNLIADSTIAVTLNGETVATGTVTISDDELSMRTTLEGDGGDGVYHVTYTACWPNQTCHEGGFTFTVDYSVSMGY